MGLYPLGTQVTIFYTFTLEDVPTDPTTVTFTIELPDESVETFVFGIDPEVTHPAVGYYELAYMPATAGTYNYKVTGTGAVIVTSVTDSFTVLGDAISAPLAGPCEPWISGADVAECCSPAISTSTPAEEFEQAAYAAQEALNVLVGGLFPGTCSRSVRPCRTDCACGVQVLSRGHIVWSGTEWNCIDDYCGCTSLSRVKLVDFPVQAITEVKIDGAIIGPAEYRLDESRYLVAMNGSRWPSCQRLDLPDTAGGTFSVTYVYGSEPPALGRMAATQLACEMYKSCALSGADGEADCLLPSGITSISRQGITIDFNAFAAWGRTDSTWRTGLPLVDIFLNTYNPSGMRRRTQVITPGKRVYPMHAG